MRTTSPASRWRRYAASVPLHAYGLGARRDFSWYFEGRSTVDVASLDDIMAWLLGCVYARDRDLFRNPDYWQHPCNFEGLRKGDCEDFALWAWCATKAHGGYSYVDTPW